VQDGLRGRRGRDHHHRAIDFPKLVRKVIRDIGYTSSDMGFDADTCAILTGHRAAVPRHQRRA
jgi:S-adenosylmethionine synthetase